MGSQRVRQDWATKHEGNSNPTQSASHPEDRELISECGSVYHFLHRESLSVNSVSWTALGHHWFTLWCKLLISSWSWFCRMGSRSLRQTLALKMLHEHPGPAPAHCSVLWAVLRVMCGGCQHCSSASAHSSLTATGSCLVAVTIKNVSKDGQCPESWGGCGGGSRGSGCE